MNMPKPFQLRVLNEKAELDEKLAALHVFINGDMFRGLSPEEQEDMLLQTKHMRDYSNTLGRRIKRF